MHKNSNNIAMNLIKLNLKKNRKSIEDNSYKINENLSKTIRTAYNIQDTKENLEDSLNLINIIKRVVLSDDVNLDKLERGDHLVIQGIGYTHHGIYIGNAEVIHYAHDEERNYISIRKDSVKKFTDGKKIIKWNSLASYSGNEIVKRAYSRLGEKKYKLMYNNCENFVIWCRNGGTF